ncbi:hypothetical protein FKW77_004856 [Venturia effusa]|uniref:Uncharacterized protein n=1 Tax=Venturia effusa TaxID=50376 RepID=A0A517L798_9PEZI|nr:hypothetical protein FKW77_004856 [Venturia effusa]
MHFQILLAVSLASLATAGETQTMDGPAIKSFISNMSNQVATIDKIIAGMTDANIATQAPALIKTMDTLNNAMMTGATQIKSSKALGVFEITSLGSSATPLITSSMSLLNNIIAKRPVMVKGNQVDALAAQLKKEQAGLVAIEEAMQTQIPASIAAQMPKGANGGAMPAGLANLDRKKLVDVVFDVGIALFKGEDVKVDVAGASIWPMAGKSGKRGVEFAA